MLDSVTKHGRDLTNSNANPGGKSGINGDAGYSSQTSSGASSGANGPSQSDATSGANGYQGSASGYANSAQSSGYGNGINSFGASVAFTDFPTGSGQGPAIYGQHQQHQQLASSNSNNNNILQSNQADQYAQQKLKQAKKTIIPIVVQVEHAILENNDLYGRQRQPFQANGANKYPQQQQLPLRPFDGLKKAKQVGKVAESYGPRNNNNNNNLGVKGGNSNNNNNNQVPFGSSSNEIGLSALLGNANPGAQYLNAANAQDINQITAAINAENAASAAAALAQADMAFGNGSPAFTIPQSAGSHQHRPQQRPNSAMSQYASGLQSAASALLANTHPVIQAAASNGLGTVSKLGAKLGEMMAIPSMQVPSVINQLSSSLPSALSSISTQVGAQLNQAVQQVAKEHPTAHAFARQVAQQAGLNLGPLSAMAQQQHNHQQQQQHQAMNSGSQPSSLQQMASQMLASASHLSSGFIPGPESQQVKNLKDLKLSVEKNIQTAQQMAAAGQFNQLWSNPFLSSLYPAALKQFSGGLLAGAGAGAGDATASQNGPANHANSGPINMDPHAQSSSIVPVVQGDSQFNGSPMLGLSKQQQQQLFSDQLQMAALMAGSGSGSDITGAKQGASAAAAAANLAGPTKSSTFKSKFRSFFQPPKFISNLLNWNDRADERNDQASPITTSTTAKADEGDDKTTTKEVTQAPVMTTVAVSTTSNQTTSSSTADLKQATSASPATGSSQSTNL